MSEHELEAPGPHEFPLNQDANQFETEIKTILPALVHGFKVASVTRTDVTQYVKFIDLVCFVS